MKAMLKSMLPTLLAAAIMTGVPLSAATAAPLTLPSDSSEIYQVSGLTPGKVLRLYSEPGRGIIVNIPHNGRWVVRRNAQVLVGDVLWEKVSWDDQTGWVVSSRLKFDPEATEIARTRRECMKNPAVKDKMCCGYPEAAKGAPFRSVPIYSVQGLKAGQSLMMYVESGETAIAVEIPHNATWVTKLGKIAQVGSDEWANVRWAGQNGWVNASYLRLDPEQTRIGDEKRRRCSNGPLLAPAKPELVCLPASVVRRLQQSNALPADLLKRLAVEAAAAEAKK